MSGRTVLSMEVMDHLKAYITNKTQEIIDNKELTDSGKCQALIDAFHQFLSDNKLTHTRLLENMCEVGKRKMGEEDADTKRIKVGRFIVSYIPIDVLSRRYMEAWTLDQKAMQTEPGASKKRKATSPIPEGTDYTTMNDVVAAYKVLKYLHSMKSVRITITKPTNMEVYFMVYELTRIESYILPAFIAECEKEGIRIPPHAEMKSLQELAYSKFTVPV